MLDPTHKYDDFRDPRIAIIVANVTAFEIAFSEQRGACWQATYQTIEQIKGQIPAQFSTEYCQEMPAETFRSTFANATVLGEFSEPNELGFSKGAKVVLGVMPDSSNTTGYTWATPTCWGPFHLNLEYDMSPTQQQAFLDGFRATDQDY